MLKFPLEIMYMSAWQTKTRGSTGNIPIFVMLLTAWGMKCSVSWLMGQDSPAVLSLLWHTTAGESFRAYTVSQKKEGWDAGENTGHRESSCSGKKSLPALAGQWKMQSMSMAAHQISGEIWCKWDSGIPEMQQHTHFSKAWRMGTRQTESL